MLDEGVVALVPQLFYNNRVEALIPPEKKEEYRAAISRLASTDEVATRWNYCNFFGRLSFLPLPPPALGINGNSKQRPVWCR